MSCTYSASVHIFFIRKPTFSSMHVCNKRIMQTYIFNSNTRVLLLRLYILTQLHRINIGICMKTITCRNRTHACICSDAWHTRVVGVTCHQQHVRKDEGKLWYWRHPLGFKLKRSSISYTTLSNLYASLCIFFLHFNLISFFSSSIFPCVSFFAFYPGENFPHRNVSITNRCSLQWCSPFWHVYVYVIHMFERTIWNSICDSSSVASNSRVHMWNESGRHPWPCIRHSHRSLCLLSVFFISWKFNHLLFQLYRSRFAFPYSQFLLCLLIDALLRLSSARMFASHVTASTRAILFMMIWLNKFICLAR